MKKQKTKPFSKGRTRARRPKGSQKTGGKKGFLIALSEEELKMEIERAARTGVSISRFIVELALRHARQILSKSA
jgi:hypothetical protein